MNWQPEHTCPDGEIVDVWVKFYNEELAKIYCGGFWIDERDGFWCGRVPDVERYRGGWRMRHRDMIGAPLPSSPRCIVTHWCRHEEPATAEPDQGVLL